MAQDIKVALTLDNKQFNSALKQSTKQVDSFAKDTESSLGGLQKAFIALGAGAVIKGIVEVGGAFQDLQNSLNVVFGGLEQGADAMARVEAFAATTQFSVLQLSKAFIQLQGAGVEPTTKLLQTFADTASVSTDQLGAFQAMLDLVTRSTAGGLGLEDLNRLADRGIPVFTILKEELGLARLEISKFGKTASGSKQIIDALLGSFDQQFGGALALQAGNINFELNQMGDAFDQLKKATFGLFSDSAASGVKGLTEAINGLAINVKSLSESGWDTIIRGLVGIAAVLAVFASRGKILGVINKGMRGFQVNAEGAIIATALFSDKLAKLGTSAGRTFTPLQNLKAIFSNLGNSIKALFGKFPTGQISKAAAGLTGLAGIVARVSQSIFSLGGAFAAFGRLALGPWGALAFAIDLVLKQFLGFSIIGVVFTAIKKLLGLFGQLAMFFIGPVIEALKGVWNQFGKLAESARKATSGVRDFLREYGLLSALPTVDDEDVKELNAGLQDAADFAAAAQEGMDRFAKSLDEAIVSSEGFLKDSEAGKFATDLENAQAQVDKAKQAIDTLSIALIGFNEELSGGKTKEELEALLAAAREAFGFASTELDNLNASYARAAEEAAQALKDIQDAIADTSDNSDLAIRVAEFKLPEVEQQVNQLLRELDDALKTETRTLTDFLKSDDLPADVRANAELALANLQQVFADAKVVGEQLTRDLFDLEQAETFNNFLTELGELDSFTGLEALRDQVIQLGRDFELTADQVDQAIQMIDQAIGNLGTEEGIKQTLADLAKSFTPFQMAVDATTAVWGNMSSAIDNLVDNGKASFSDLAKSIVKDLVKMIMKAYIFNAIMGLGTKMGFDMSFLKGRASGGPVSPNTPYMVGEKGPELFVPKGSGGDIVPNNALGGGGPVTNNYITNNIQALDSKSVAQVFAENRESLLGTVEYARKETAYGV